jgi:hypothetical protein
LDIEADQNFGAEFHAEAKRATGLGMLLINVHEPGEPYAPRCMVGSSLTTLL